MVSLFYYLLCDRHAFMAVREELKGAFQTISEISDQKLTSLVYLNACLNETLRLSPPVNGKYMQRVSLGVTIDDIYVPKGVRYEEDLALESVLTISRSRCLLILCQCTVPPSTGTNPSRFDLRDGSIRPQTIISVRSVPLDLETGFVPVG